MWSRGFEGKECYPKEHIGGKYYIVVLLKRSIYIGLLVQPNVSQLLAAAACCGLGVKFRWVDDKCGDGVPWWWYCFSATSYSHTHMLFFTTVRAALGVRRYWSPKTFCNYNHQDTQSALKREQTKSKDVEVVWTLQKLLFIYFWQRYSFTFWLAYFYWLEPWPHLVYCCDCNGVFFSVQQRRSLNHLIHAYNPVSLCTAAAASTLTKRLWLCTHKYTSPSNQMRTTIL